MSPMTKLPVRCPVCQDIMLTEFMGHFILIKKCFRHPDHWIKLIADADGNTVREVKILIDNDPVLYATWQFSGKLLFLSNVEISKGVKEWLPWFDPDLTDYKKLLEKVKTYLVFS
jgi:hypothetical protein